MTDVGALAKTCVGWGYKHHGRYDPSASKQFVDCWGLFSYCMERLGVTVPDVVYTQEWARERLDFLKEYHQYAEPISDQEALPGDAVLMRGHHRDPNHVGVYLGKGRMLHCVQSTGVVITQLAKEGSHRFA